MANMEHNPEMDDGQAWVGRFIELQLKELGGATLTPEEERFLAGIELAGRLVPGGLEQAVLEYGLGDPALTEEDEPLVLRVAASTGQSHVYEEVQRALQNGASRVTYQIGGGGLELLQIDEAEMVVEPLYQEGYTFVIERKGGGKQLVGRYGGTFIAIEDLKNMTLEYDPAAKVISLLEK